MNVKPITRFEGEYRFLSNYDTAPFMDNVIARESPIEPGAIVWTLGFETPYPHALPYAEVEGSANFVLAFAQSVTANKWLLTTIKRS